MANISEHTLQRQIVDLFRKARFKVFVLDAATGVGYFQSRDPRRFAFLADLKARGYTKGQPDLCVIRNRIWFLELKKTPRARVGAEQKDMLAWLQEHGHNAAIISSVDEALRLANNPMN